jgi:hypothetical protein
MCPIVIVQTPLLTRTALVLSGEGGRQSGSGVAFTALAQRLGYVWPRQMATLPASPNDAIVFQKNLLEFKSMCYAVFRYISNRVSTQGNRITKSLYSR